MVQLRLGPSGPPIVGENVGDVLVWDGNEWQPGPVDNVTSSPLQFAADVVNPVITQEDAPSGAADDLTIRPQSTPSGNAGDLALVGGEGTTSGGSVVVRPGGAANGQINLRHSDNTNAIVVTGDAPVYPGPALVINNNGLDLFGAGVMPSVTGSRGGNAALASLLTTLETMQLITDDTTA